MSRLFRSILDYSFSAFYARASSTLEYHLECLCTLCNYYNLLILGGVECLSESMVALLSDLARTLYNCIDKFDSLANYHRAWLETLQPDTV